MALRLEDTADWAREPKGNPELTTLFGCLEANQRPAWSETTAAGQSLRGLCSQCEGPALRDRVLGKGGMAGSSELTGGLATIMANQD